MFAEEPEEASQAYDVDDVCRGVRFESAQQVRNCSAIRQRAGRGGPGSSRYVRILGSDVRPAAAAISAKLGNSHLLNASKRSSGPSISPEEITAPMTKGLLIFNLR